MKKFLGPKLGLKLGFLPISQCPPLVFLDIAQDCSLGQYLTLSRAETFNNKKICGTNWGRNDLFYSKFIEDPLKLACLICCKCKPQFLTENFRKSFVLNGLCLVWPILDLKNILLLTFIVSKWSQLTVLKDLVSHKNSKLKIFFCLNLSWFYAEGK